MKISIQEILFVKSFCWRYEVKLLMRYKSERFIFLNLLNGFHSQEDSDWAKNIFVYNNHWLLINPENSKVHLISVEFMRPVRFQMEWSYQVNWHVTVLIKLIKINWIWWNTRLGWIKAKKLIQIEISLPLLYYKAKRGNQFCTECETILKISVIFSFRFQEVFPRRSWSNFRLM